MSCTECGTRLDDNNRFSWCPSTVKAGATGISGSTHSWLEEGKSKPTIFFDLDGVLANFDKAAEAILGTNNIYRFEFVHGQDEFWRLLNTEPNFFRNMERMPGALHLCGAVPNFMNRAKILTALPKTNGERVDAQKREWVAEHISRYVEVITCLTHEKPDYCKPGDILIDDRAVNKRRWEEKGGKFVLHENVGNTLAQLESLGVKA